MNLTLYKTVDSENVINKVLTQPLNFTINVKKDFDIVKPVIYLSDVSQADLTGYNYCEISDINRKYVIDNISVVNYRIVQLECHCDVLETYKNDILNSDCEYNGEIGVGDYGNVIGQSSITEFTSYESDTTINTSSSITVSTISVQVNTP